MKYSMLDVVTEQAEKLSYSDTVALISILEKKIDKKSNEDLTHKNFVSELLAFSEKNSERHKSTEKWSRDELHRA